MSDKDKDRDERREAMRRKYEALAQKADEEGDGAKAEKMRVAARRCES
jgi:hypothetical protein